MCTCTRSCLKLKTGTTDFALTTNGSQAEPTFRTSDTHRLMWHLFRTTVYPVLASSCVGNVLLTYIRPHHPHSRRHSTEFHLIPGAHERTPSMTELSMESKRCRILGPGLSAYSMAREITTSAVDQSSMNGIVSSILIISSK